MKKTIALFLLIIASVSFIESQTPGNEPIQFRPPSVPLITHDPYFSIWSPADRLTDMETVHWTGTRNPIHSMIRIDGKTYRLMGANPSPIEPMKQLSLKVTPTSTIYEFGNQNVKVSVNFTSPLLVKDIDILSRPVTYLTWNVTSLDNKAHDIQIYFDCSSELCVNNPEQNITWDQPDINSLKTARIGSQDQKYLNRSGDNVRIDWGYIYLAIPKVQNSTVSIAPRNTLFKSFSSSGKLPDAEPFSAPKRVRDGFISMATVWDLGKTGTAGASVWAMVAYDDIYSIRYFENDLQAWWRRTGLTFDKMLTSAASNYSKLMSS